MNEVVYYITYLHRCVPDYEACSLLNLVGILITSQVLLLQINKTLVNAFFSHTVW